MGVESLFFRKKRSEDDKSFIRKRAPIAGFNGDESGGFELHVTGSHIYLECGKGKPIIFCSGLYGSIYNVSALGSALSQQYRFIVPYLPMYELPLSECTVPRLADYLQTFAEDLALSEVVIIGSSMGGGAALYFALKKPDCLKALILCGSSGLSTIPMQKGFFRRKDYTFVKQATQEVFF